MGGLGCRRFVRARGAHTLAPPPPLPPPHAHLPADVGAGARLGGGGVGGGGLLDRNGHLCHPLVGLGPPPPASRLVGGGVLPRALVASPRLPRPCPCPYPPRGERGGAGLVLLAAGVVAVAGGGGGARRARAGSVGQPPPRRGLGGRGGVGVADAHAVGGVLDLRGAGGGGERGSLNARAGGQPPSLPHAPCRRCPWLLAGWEGGGVGGGGCVRWGVWGGMCAMGCVGGM